MCYFSHHGDFVVCHAYIHNGVFLDIGFQFFLYHVFRLAFGETADVQCAQDREINVPVIVYQILLQGWLVGKVLLFAVMGVATVRLKGMAASGSLVFTVMVSKSLGMMCASYRGVWTFAMFRYSESCR